MNILLLILWIVIGAINIATAAADGGEISIISYVCCWVLLLIYLIRDCLD